MPDDSDILYIDLISTDYFVNLMGLISKQKSLVS